MKKAINILVLAVTVLFASCKDPLPPVIVTTGEVTEITTNSAQIEGSVTITGNAAIVELGLCWSTKPNPEVGDNYVSTSNVSELFTYTLTELELETEYHVRAYAFDETTYYYGEDVCFNTLPKGLFTVSNESGRSKKVRFSQGNLQYQASTDTWRFAEHQWDYIGYSKPDQYGYTYGTVNGSSNHLIGPDYDGWIDLFGWGTSGQNHGAACYQPWSTSSYNWKYYAYGNPDANLYEMGQQADWGVNPISNGGNQAGLWRTLTIREWKYLLRERTTPSGLKYVGAMVNDVDGIVLLPDDWDNSIRPLVYEQLYCNRISLEDWTLLEENGAAFLPLTGERHETTVSGCYNYGGYWTSSTPKDYYQSSTIVSNSNNACNIQLDYTDYYLMVTERHTGLAVRLVQDYPLHTSGNTNIR